MKIAHFDLIIEIEKILEVKLIQKYGQEFSLLISPEGKSLSFLEIGEIDYNSIEIYNKEKKISVHNNKEEFWEIINFLESDEKINETFKRLENNMRESSPHLFEEEIDLNKNYKIKKLNNKVVLLSITVLAISGMLIKFLL